MLPIGSLLPRFFTMKPICWITYAWKDNENQDVDFIAQELESEGVSVKLDRWTLSAGKRLWEQLEPFITDPSESDGWILIATAASLQSEPCKEEYAYALDRALHMRGGNYPIIALFREPVDNSLIPAGIKTRLFVSITYPDWKERIKSALERRDPNITRPEVKPYYLKRHPTNARGRTAIEVRPRAGVWFPFIAGIPLAEKDRCQLSIMPGAPNPLRPRAFGGKGAEGMKKEIPSNNSSSPDINCKADGIKAR